MDRIWNVKAVEGQQVRLKLDRKGIAAVSVLLSPDEARDLIYELAAAAGLDVDTREAE